MARVKAPNATYEGTGPGGARFSRGVATVRDEAALAYYRAAGYIVDGEQDTELPGQPEPLDPRTVDVEQLGTRLRDGAVDPRPEDFLGPINAGDENPHGSQVINPEIHASGPAGIRPGPVLVEDVRKQEAREAEYARVRVIEQTPADEAITAELTATAAGGDTGPLGLSDPGSGAIGAADAEPIAAAEAKTADAAERKARRAATRAAKAAAGEQEAELEQAEQAAEAAEQQAEQQVTDPIGPAGAS